MPHATFHKTMTSGREDYKWTTLEKLATALRTSDHWLRHGGDNGPVPNGPVPPRPGQDWKRHGELPGWKESIERLRAEAEQRVPGAAYFAGADLIVFCPVDSITPELALAVSAYAWETRTPAERRRYEDLDIQEAERLAAERRGKPAAKRRVAK